MQQNTAEAGRSLDDFDSCGASLRLLTNFNGNIIMSPPFVTPSPILLAWAPPALFRIIARPNGGLTVSQWLVVLAEFIFPNRHYTLLYFPAIALLVQCVALQSISYDPLEIPSSSTALSRLISPSF
jgi:hypothetical protein